MEPGGELEYQSLELIPGSGAAQLLTNLSVLIQTKAITNLALPLWPYVT